MKELVYRYFREHPEKRDEVMKAYYAFHASHFRLEPKGHYFTSCLRESRCRFCDRSREDVRYDQRSPECDSRPLVPEIWDVVAQEEKKALILSQRASNEVPRLVKRFGLSEATFERLHSTYGYDREAVEEALK
jgi:hypothetical protein